MVTGAGQGIGKAVAEELARDGAAVAVVDINEATAVQTAAEVSRLGVMARAYRVDISHKEQVEAVVEARAHRATARRGIDSIYAADAARGGDLDQGLREP